MNLFINYGQERPAAWRNFIEQQMRIIFPAYGIVVRSTPASSRSGKIGVEMGESDHLSASDMALVTTALARLEREAEQLGLGRADTVSAEARPDWRDAEEPRRRAWLEAHGCRIIALDRIAAGDLFFHYAQADGLEIQYTMMEGRHIDAASLCQKKQGKDWEPILPEHQEW